VIRILDIVFATLGLVFGLPFLVVIYVVGLFDTGSPLFRQERVGRYKKPFILVKFRTMVPDTKSVASHLADSSSITSVGRFLRQTKLDELPQLWNVLKGEMSLVGPRPCLFNQVELVQERESRGVLDVRPGITGPTQIRYRHEETLLSQYADREAAYINVVMPQKLAIDLEYVEHHTFPGDLLLIAQTVLAVFSPDQSAEAATEVSKTPTL